MHTARSLARVPAVGWVPLVLAVLAAAIPSLAAGAGSARPDLVVKRVSAPAPASLRAGERVRIQAQIRNAGRRAARPSASAVWLSSDARRSKGDVRVARRAVKRLAGRGAATTAVRVTIPAGTRPGRYFLLVCADGGARVRERDERNNCAAAKGALTVAVASPPTPGVAGPPAPSAAAPADGEPPAPAATPSPEPPPAGDRPDLAVAEVSDPPLTAQEGSTFAVTDAVTAAGAPAPASQTRFYLARDAEDSLAERRESREDPRGALADILMGGGRAVPALAPGERSESEAPGTVLTVPIGTPPGVYHLLACADDRGAVAESAEEANCAAATHPVDGQERPSPVRIVAEAQEYRVDTLPDILDQPDLGDDERTLASLRESFCQNTTVGSVPSVPEAVASAKRFLTETAGAAAMAQFAASPEYADARKAEAAAGSAVIAGHPGAALAALVRAHELEPAEASHLVNAAAVASSVGLPAEALAMLDGARRLDYANRPAMGIPRHAVTLANRGQALAMLGRRDEADRALTGALAAEPLLAEANLSRSAVAVCREGAKPAAKLLRASRQRQGPKPIDLSRGRESSMRDLPLPGFPKQAAGMRDFYRDQANGFEGEIQAHNDRERTLDERIGAKQAEWTRAQRNRHYATFSRIHKAGAEPAIKAKWDVMSDKLDEVNRIHADFWVSDQHGTGTYKELSTAANAECEGAPEDYSACYRREMQETCRPALRLAHQAWVDEMQETYDAGQVYFRALSKRMSAYAAHLADPDAHAKALLAIEQQEQSLYALIQQPAGFWTHFVFNAAEYCVEQPDATTDAIVPDGAAAASDGACSPQLKAMNVVAELGPTKVKISCEKVQQSLKLEVIPWVQAFVEVTYDTRHGKLMVLAGSKGEVDLGVAKGTFKSGLYVATDRYGTVDVGWRVGPSATVGAGAAEMKLYDDEFNLSFVGAVSSTFGL